MASARRMSKFGVAQVYTHAKMESADFEDPTFGSGEKAGNGHANPNPNLHPAPTSPSPCLCIAEFPTFVLQSPGRFRQVTSLAARREPHSSAFWTPTKNHNIDALPQLQPKLRCTANSGRVLIRVALASCNCSSGRPQHASSQSVFEIYIGSCTLDIESTSLMMSPARCCTINTSLPPPLSL
eukprot:jgi/Botrbrau1/18202/Bobra.53_1s0061.1